MRRALFASALAALSTFALACGDDDATSKAARYELDDGTLVEVGDDGTVTLSLAGATSPPIVLLPRASVASFEAYRNELLGSYAFFRENERRTHFDVLVSSEKSGDTVRIVHRSRSGGELETIVSTQRSGEATKLRFSPDDPDYDAIAFDVACDAEASFFGFGEQYHATNHRGEVVPLFVSEQGIGRKGEDNTTGLAGGPHTTYYAMPYWVDARGFGVLARSNARAVADLCSTDASAARLELEQREPLEVLLFHGPTSFDVVRELGDEVGRPARPPSWATLPWMAAQGGRENVLSEVEALESAQIPFGAMWVQDWTGIRQNVGGGFGVEYRWEVDDELYPELPAMVAELRARGIRFLAYANPFVDQALPDHFAEMAARGLLVKNASGDPYVFACPAGAAGHPDFSNPEAKLYVKDALARMVTEFGFDGWMADFGEWNPLDAVLADGSDPVAYHNRYPELWHEASREVMDELRPDGDYAIFTRSGHVGQQRVAQIVWVGDQEADFEHEDGLPSVVPAMLSLGMSGLPFVTHDVAGFSGGPSTKELFQRWTELGAFSPIMRTHDGNAKLDNWRWSSDPETVQHFRRFARIHVALAPELDALFDEAAATSKPVVRHLAFAFPDEPELRAIDDQFLLGDELLVAPVLTEGATSRKVVLPAGATWFDVWSGERLEGGQSIDRAAPIGSPPVFSRGRDRNDLRAID